MPFNTRKCKSQGRVAKNKIEVPLVLPLVEGKRQNDVSIPLPLGDVRMNA